MSKLLSVLVATLSASACAPHLGAPGVMPGRDIQRELSVGGVVADGMGGVAAEVSQLTEVKLPASLSLTGVAHLRVTPELSSGDLEWRALRSIDPRLGLRLLWEHERLRLGAEVGALPLLSPFGVTLMGGSAYSALYGGVSAGPFEFFARVDGAAGITYLYTATMVSYEHSAVDASAGVGAAATWRRLRFTLFAGWMVHRYRYSRAPGPGSGGFSLAREGPMAALRLGYVWPADEVRPARQ